MTATVQFPASKPGFGDALLAEWTKLRSVQSTIWSLVVFAAVTVSFAVLPSAAAVLQWDNGDPRVRASVLADPTNLFMSSGLFVGQLAICVLGVMVITTEYATGTIRPTLLAVPRRLPVLGAKVVVFGLLTLVVSLAVCFTSFFAGATILQSKISVSLGDPGVLRAVVGGGLYLSTLGVYSMAIGAVIRHTAGGIATVIGSVLVLPPLVTLLPGSVAGYVYAYLPSEAGRLITQAIPADHALLTPWQGYGVFVLWTVLLLVAAAAQLKSRDA